MTRFARQRYAGWTWLLLISAVLWIGEWRYRDQLVHFDVLSGWGLLGFMVLLALYNGRKKLPFLPLGSSEAWLQFHLYAGGVSLVGFGIHSGWRWPSGWFDTLLAGSFWVVFTTGIGGLVLSRVLPRRLTTRGGEVIYERIPAIHRALVAEAEALAMRALPERGSTTLADFYTRRIAGFLTRRPQLWIQWAGNRRALNRMLEELRDLDRYLDAAEREQLVQIAALIRRKDDLDYHYALQWLLKHWLFIHIPATVVLLVLAIVHGMLMLAFSGGAA